MKHNSITISMVINTFFQNDEYREGAHQTPDNGSKPQKQTKRNGEQNTYSQHTVKNQDP